MIQFNFPTTILYGEDALTEGAKRIYSQGQKHLLLVTDKTVAKLALADSVRKELLNAGLEITIFDNVHPNPIEEDVEKGVEAYRKGGCDSILALGGGSPIDAAKVIALAVNHPAPLAQYDDAKGGFEKITHPIPPLFAIPTTAGTGSEVGRSGVIIMRETNEKTIFFHPKLLPSLAILAPQLTVDLPSHISAATGIDAFTHCLEAFFSPGFHPIADGIALEGLRLVLKNLPIAVQDGANLKARGEMLVAASMGATAFQKGLGMIHSMAHPLSSESNLHHGLANALLLPSSIRFLERSPLTETQRQSLRRVQLIFEGEGLAKETLSASCTSFFQSLGIQFGLKNHGIKKDDLSFLAEKAYKDTCHLGNMIPVLKDHLYEVYLEAFE